MRAGNQLSDQRSRARWIALAGGVAALLACGDPRGDQVSQEPQEGEVPPEAQPAEAPAPEAEPSPEPVETSAVNDPQWRTLVAKLGALYFTWGQVDDEMRWAPGLCRMPQPAQARLSESGDPSTHGSKIYLLYAKDPQAYGYPPGRPLSVVGPDGVGLPASTMREDPDVEALEQVLVKEAYVPVEVSEQANQGPFMSPRPAMREGKAYTPGERLGLYIMAKVGDASTPGTDAGWIYATVDPGGNITSAGEVASCMGCHHQNEGRVFGIKKAQ